MDPDERNESLQDVGMERGAHDCTVTVQYCIELFHEHMETEAENERHLDAEVSDILQRRLVVSLAGWVNPNR